MQVLLSHMLCCDSHTRDSGWLFMITEPQTCIIWLSSQYYGAQSARCSVRDYVCVLACPVVCAHMCVHAAASAGLFVFFGFFFSDFWYICERLRLCLDRFSPLLSSDTHCRFIGVCVCVVVVVHVKGDAGRQRDALLHPHHARQGCGNAVLGNIRVTRVPGRWRPTRQWHVPVSGTRVELCQASHTPFSLFFTIIESKTGTCKFLH